MQYILTKENPAVLSNEPHLYYTLTNEIMSDDICSDLVQFLSKVKEFYGEFPSKQFLKKENKISDTIHGNNMKTFLSIKNPKPKLNNTATKGKTSLVPSSYLFDEEGLMIES